MYPRLGTRNGRAEEGESEIDFGSTHPIVLRYRVTRSSLISDRQIEEREREKAGGVVSFQLPAPKTNDPHGRGVISPDPGLENATNYNRIRMVGAATPVEPRCSCFSYAVFALPVSFPRIPNYVSRVSQSKAAAFLLEFNGERSTS